MTDPINNLIPYSEMLAAEKVRNSKPLLVVRYEAGSNDSHAIADRARADLIALGYDVLVTDDTVEVVSPNGYPQVAYGIFKSPMTKEAIESLAKACAESKPMVVPSWFCDKGGMGSSEIQGPLMGKVRATIFVDSYAFNSSESFFSSPEVPVQCLPEDKDVERNMTHIIGRARNFNCYLNPWNRQFEISCDIEVPEILIDYDSKTGLKHKASCEIHKNRGVVGVMVLVKRSEIK